MISPNESHAPTSPLVQQSSWKSPVPYLFGGLAAMLGLIAFALLILACSYWKLSGYLDGDDDNSGERDIELGAGGANSAEKTKLPSPVLEEKFLVIMAGQEKPTFLATPISSRNSSFGSKIAGGEVSGESDGGRSDQVRSGNMETRETSDQVP